MKEIITKNVFGVLVVFISLSVGCKNEKVETTIVEGAQNVKSSSGIDINYTITGQGDHTLVFVHGWSCNQTYWDKQVDYFKDKYQVVTIDLGGHGNSGSNRDDWSMEAFGSDVLEVINKLKYQEISVIGHSMGSVVVMDAATRIKNQPQAIVFVDFFKDKPSVPPTKEQLTTRTASFRSDFKNSTKGFVKTMFLPTSDSLLVNKISNDMSNANPDVAIPAMMNMLMTDFDKGFKLLLESKKNAHLINSDKRPINNDYFNSLGIKPHTIANTGHFLMIEESEKFNTILENILNKTK